MASRTAFKSIPSVWSILANAGVLLVVSSAEGQSARRVPGYWVGLAAAGASGGLACEGCTDTDSRLGPSAVVTLGKTVSRKVAFGLEVSGWRRSIDRAVDHQGYLMATAYVFPGWAGTYLSGGVGLGRFVSAIDRERDRTSSLAGAVRLGVGYDMPLGRELSFAPFVSYYRSTAADLKVNGNSAGTDITQHLLQVGAGLQWNFTGAISFPAPTED
jgi:hypothetical protein